MVQLKCLFLSIEDIDDNTDKHIEYEKRSHHHEHEEKEDSSWGVVFYRNLVDLGGVNSAPHNADPSFSCHNVE